MKRISRTTLIFLGSIVAFTLVVQVLISLNVLSPFWNTILRQGAVMAIVSLGLNLIYGFNGQFSLGQWGFYAIGAYSAADITYRWTNDANSNGLTVLFFTVVLVGAAILILYRVFGKIRGVDPLSAFAIYLIAAIGLTALAVSIGNITAPGVNGLLKVLPANIANTVVYLLAVIIGGVLAAEVSFLFGLPVLTLGSDYFGIATLGFTIIVKVLLDNSDVMFGFVEMKGARGMIGIPKLTSWIWVMLFLILVLVITRNLLHSSYGRAIISVREDEIAAKAMGIDIGHYKTLTFVLGCLFAGLAGGLYAHINGFLHPDTFNFIKSFDPMIIVVFGGLGSVTGTIFAAFAWQLVLEGILRSILPPGFETWRYVVYPLLLLVMMLLKPNGLFGNYEIPYLRQVLPPKKSTEPKPAQTAKESL
ncbi:branched-chain amino acid ABC transporter permease [Anaerolinea thermophila]|uniref:Branched-chain amino acid ABC transporter permease protein n=1 Tax=Anaerolinea thermophila (strain DSM 14523 / JCM 11388 / NBRC 100420 / UNI-1) TaxID=926569 RepID=E8N4F8_ANATU|nr:branched-chain amino acid ABC transporter permease [Anaerolinea thermophila]BAJ63322.1 branched-chain amino acid ABC transporter permease protein [Anaerolinea thermophila UNI-1]